MPRVQLDDEIMNLRFVFLFLLLTLPSCASKPAIFLDGMGDHFRVVSTDSELAQEYFNQGLTLSYGFMHDEAIRSFSEAASLDPSCAMHYWGIAYALGPNINSPLSKANGLRAKSAMEYALRLAVRATPVERDLIEALDTRYEFPFRKKRKDLDRAYAAAMKEVWAKYPNDPDVGFLYADALINISPWDQWTPDFEPKENTLDAIAALERVLKLDESHPGANHFYIHVMEASAQPERAEAVADRLASLVPGLGHLVHMPSHIYIQTGRFHDSMLCNKKASDLDREYFAKTGDQGGYHFYHAHNNHFRVWAAMYQGAYESALAACQQTLIDLPESMQGIPAAAEWLVMDLHVHLRFGEWEKVLERESPREDQPYAVALWRYARGMAFANTQRIELARKEVIVFEEIAMTMQANPDVDRDQPADVLRIAREMVHGEIEYHAGNFELGFKHLRAAVAAEDALRYSEPSPWMMPTRHALAALLLERGKVKQAEENYRRDLREHPGNGWSLFGLASCLEKQGRMAEAGETRRKFELAWANATVEIKASCFCAGKNETPER